MVWRNDNLEIELPYAFADYFSQTDFWRKHQGQWRQNTQRRNSILKLNDQIGLNLHRPAVVTERCVL
jgi:hypothetical protein